MARSLTWSRILGDSTPKELLKAFLRSLTPRSLLVLMLCMLVDVIGCISYLLPAIGETFDIIWAPISAWYFVRILLLLRR